MVSKKKKKTRSSPKLRLIFRPNSEIQTFEGGCFPMGGGYFQFFTKNRSQKHQKRAICILHKPMEGLQPPRPPLATLLDESSRTHFEVVGLGLEASCPRKLPCSRLEDSTIFEPLKFRWKMPETLRKVCKDLFLVSSSTDRLKKIFEDLFFKIA